MTRAARRLVFAAAPVIAVISVCAVAAHARQAAADRQDRPTFGATVDVISVDVQVVDDEGRPVSGLDADSFEVTINGRRRRVVSADFIDSRPAAERLQAGPADAAAVRSSAPPVTPPSPAPRRIYILAVDAASFDESTARPVLIAAAAFIRNLQPQDEVGLFAYPIGPKIDPTTDHDAVSRALATITSARETAPPGEFYLTPSNVVELSRVPSTGLAENLIATFCPDPDDTLCLDRLDMQVRGEVMFYEGAAYSGTATLRALVTALGTVTERKTLVLVSGGVVSSDIVGGRPDLGSIASDLGKAAAQSNVNVYTLFIDQLWMRQMSAESRRPPVAPDRARESDLTSRLLDSFSGTSGGTLLRVSAGDGTLAFNRILSETSAHYLLGVEPTDEDADGRPRELGIRVRGRDVTVRGRSWIGLPVPPTSAVTAATAPAGAIPDAEKPAPSLPPATPAVQRLAEAFERDDLSAMTEALAPSNASLLLREFREHESPFPSSPRRTAAFALDLAMTGVRTASAYTREEALRVLAEYVVRVRQPEQNDPFECTWLWAASAGTTGLFTPEISGIVTERAVERCPDDGNLHLARAVARDQQLVGTQRRLAPAGDRAGEPTELEERVLELYAGAAAFSTVRFEARLRAAQVLFRANRFDEALAAIDSAGPAPDDPQLRYLNALIGGQLLEAVGRLDEAAAAFHAAEAAWPGAQAPRVSLMALLVSQGRTDEAASLADAVFAEPATASDPWWIYYLGDNRLYPMIRAHLRTLAP